MIHQKIESATVTALFGKSTPKLVDVQPRRPFRVPGEGLNETIYVCTGLLAILRTYPGGGRAIVALRFPDEAILGNRRAAGFGIEALIPSSVAITTSRVHDGDACLKMLQRNEAIAYEWLVRQTCIDAVGRVAHLLCETAIRSGQGIAGMYCPFTQVQIAEITGQTNVNVNRVLSDLEALGLVTRDRRAMTFHDWDGLARLGRFQAGYLSPAAA